MRRWPCIEITKTTSWGASAPPERLGDYATLVAWAEREGLLSGVESRELKRAASADPAGAERVRAEALRLRGVLYRVLSGLARGRTPRAVDLEALSEAAARVLPQRRLRREGSRIAWSWLRSADLERPLWPVVASAAELLVDGPVDRLKACDADDCGWLFLDESRNRSRRWCDMAECGNRAKVRRYRARRRDAE